MTPKPEPTSSKTSQIRPARKSVQRATDTGRLFIHVNEITRRPSAATLTRYVE